MSSIIAVNMLFRRKKEESNAVQLNAALDTSFQNVRQDIYNVFSWLNYLNERLLSVQKQLDALPASKEEIRHIIDGYYSYDGVLRKIDEIHERIDSLAAKQKHFPEELEDIRARLSRIVHPVGKVAPQPRTVVRAETAKLDEISQRLKHIEDSRKKNVREVMVQKITKNSKTYVKNVIVQLIRKYGEIPALKLKEMVVDEQGLCSKSSFYRLLNEVQEEAEVSVAHSGKEKQIVFKLTKNN